MKGRLTQWDDAKGYGFITPDDGGPKLFVHAKAFGLRPQRPVVGERLSYREGQDAQGKRRAQDVRSLEPRAAPPSPAPRDHLAWGVPNWFWGAYSAMSTATFIVYWMDKRAAQRGGWRVAEGTLHWLSLACGWPGALLAQHLLRHKNAKRRFRRVYWLTVVANIAAFVAFFTPLLKS
jgi:uncharacterized membrane protein YsdA (DUF1294 family)/cold shock CspA family protein